MKLERGTDALIQILDRGRVTELLDPNRPSYAEEREIPARPREERA